MSVETHVLLLRGVNVGGNNKLPMEDFRGLLADLGLLAPETHIQSGNAVVQSDLPVSVIADRVRRGLDERFGLTVPVFVLQPEELEAALTDHPFTGMPQDKVHAFFLEQPSPAPAEARLKELAAPGDGWLMKDRLFILHTPAGLGTSRLAEKLPSMIFGQLTARNLNTVAALLAMVRARQATA